MTRAQHVAQWLHETLERRLDELDIPAASVAVYVDGELVEHGAGVLNRGTGVENTVDGVFQIGSITKVWTATLVMQLVDEGIVALDEPVLTYLPEFSLEDADAAAAVTVRQLLTHTAGFEGDVFRDTGVGDDALEIFIRGIGDVPQLFTPGEQFSYNNLAFCVLGRLVEVLRGMPYDQALHQYVITPLGLTHAATDAAQAIRFRAALGHLDAGEGGPVVPAPIWAMQRSNSPAGSMLAMTARDLIAFAAMHLRGGVAEDGTRVLSEASVEAMQVREVDLPRLEMLGDAWGLGWELMDTNIGTMIGHDGNTIGQASFLRVLPEHGIAVALLTNGGNVYPLSREIFAHILGELAGVEYKHLPTPPTDAEPIDASRFVGTYGASVMDLTVTQDAEQRIWIDIVPKGLAIELGETAQRSEYVPFGPDRIIAVEPTSGMFMPFVFIGADDDGNARYLHTGRAMPRVAG
ncbi:serine hydrolase [Microbacterium sp. C7(2022)]|uniref:serine hydrolase domain-containing protein n=1 Tax=Microbacterium sp. C7(2022) TaxID=2992759 RepID=UPI00237B8480|nr:serine hydrolase domain-containing protein [Microbacterium sp. C7(2022)]MDE0545417.1 beta-lactamase family protein [Microbacterium sp. C7(2022)]